MASKKVRAQISRIFERQRAQLAAGSAAGLGAGALTGVLHNVAEERGFSMTIPKTKVGWLTAAGIVASGVALARRRKWSIPVAMGGTALAASDLAVQITKRG